MFARISSDMSQMRVYATAKNVKAEPQEICLDDGIVCSYGLAKLATNLPTKIWSRFSKSPLIWLNIIIRIMYEDMPESSFDDGHSTTRT